MRWESCDLHHRYPALPLHVPGESAFRLRSVTTELWGKALVYVRHCAPQGTSPQLGAGSTPEATGSLAQQRHAPLLAGRAAMYRDGKRSGDGCWRRESGCAPSDARELPAAPAAHRRAPRYSSREQLHRLSNTSPRRLSQPLGKHVYESRPGIIPGTRAHETPDFSEQRDEGGGEAFPGPQGLSLSLKICCSPRSRSCNG